MSTERKLRGGQATAPGRLKALVLKKPEVGEELWSWRNNPELTNEAIRGRIEANWGITFKRDNQLSEFWPWLRTVRRQNNWNARMEQFEAWYREKTPDASAERIRDAGIAFFMTETLADEDRKGFAEMAGLDLQKRGMQTRAKLDGGKLSLAERKYQDALKSKLQLGLDELAAAFKGNAKAMEFYQQARGLINRG